MVLGGSKAPLGAFHDQFLLWLLSVPAMKTVIRDLDLGAGWDCREGEV